MSAIIRTIRYFTLSPLEYLFLMLLNTYTVLKSVLVEGHHGKRLIFQNIALQIYFTAIQAMSIIIITGVIIGTAVLVELAIILPRFGAESHMERMFVIVVVRELIPIMTALIVIGRSGTAMATELGNMKLNRELELMDSVGINTDYFLVLPRLIGIIVSIMCLTIIFNVSALVGGFLFAGIFKPTAIGIVFKDLLLTVDYRDIIISMLKAFLFGWVIAIVNCSHGLSVKRSFTEIPQVTTTGVVNSIIFCFVINIFISLYVYSSFNI
ncbi:MAG: ABC transporter permease [Planctomycetes bacterium]|nr:ABC transporter permease [Planctomycetota bacterium]